MNDLFDQFRDQSGSVRVDPHPGTWDRIESRVNAYRSTRRLTRTRLFSIAAVMLCVISVATALTFYVQRQAAYDATQYTQGIEELSTGSLQGESIYDVGRIKGYYALLGNSQ